MVFPLYSLLLTVSSTGVPSGISKIISGGENPESVLKTSLAIFLPIGFLLSLIIFISSVNSPVLSASILISLATTAKPLPAAPALAASTAALRARIFVWNAISSIVLLIFLISFFA